MAAHVDISLSAFGRCLEHEHLVALRLWRWANRNARAAALECACAAARVGFVRAITPQHSPQGFLVHPPPHQDQLLLRTRQMWRSCTVCLLDSLLSFLVREHSESLCVSDEMRAAVRERPIPNVRCRTVVWTSLSKTTLS
jgi:hypothetical protein